MVSAKAEAIRSTSLEFQFHVLQINCFKYTSGPVVSNLYFAFVFVRLLIITYHFTVIYYFYLKFMKNIKYIILQPTIYMLF